MFSRTDMKVTCDNVVAIWPALSEGYATSIIGIFEAPQCLPSLSRTHCYNFFFTPTQGWMVEDYETGRVPFDQDFVVRENLKVYVKAWFFRWETKQPFRGVTLKKCTGITRTALEALQDLGEKLTMKDLKVQYFKQPTGLAKSKEDSNTELMEEMVKHGKGHVHGPDITMIPGKDSKLYSFTEVDASNDETIRVKYGAQKPIVDTRIHRAKMRTYVNLRNTAVTF